MPPKNAAGRGGARPSPTAESKDALEELLQGALWIAESAPAPTAPAPMPAAQRPVAAQRAAATSRRPSVDLADEEALRSAVKGEDFSFKGRRFLAKVVEVYDGDTIRVIFRHGAELVQHKARMAGYDSPELRPLKSNPNRAKEQAAALAARDALLAKVGDELVIIECGAPDKYGRLLVTAFKRAGPRGADNGESLNAWMIAQGHGMPYFGGTKKAFEPAPDTQEPRDSREA